MKRTVTRPKPQTLEAILDANLTEYEHLEGKFRQLYASEASLKYARVQAFRVAGFNEEQALALLLDGGK